MQAATWDNLMLHSEDCPKSKHFDIRVEALGGIVAVDMKGINTD